jgi:hypothetical protein
MLYGYKPVLLKYAVVDNHTCPLLSTPLNFSYTQRYLGNISDIKATKSIDNLYGSSDGVRVKAASDLAV